MDIAFPPAHLSLLADPPVPRVEARARVVTGGRNIITSWCTQTSHRMWHRRPPPLVRGAALHPGALADAVAGQPARGGLAAAKYGRHQIARDATCEATSPWLCSV